jgi:hypothetical protein
MKVSKYDLDRANLNLVTVNREKVKRQAENNKAKMAILGG